MKRTGTRSRRLSGALLFFAALGAVSAPTSAFSYDDRPECRIANGISVMFKPGTPEREMDAVMQRMGLEQDFQPQQRWSSTHGGSTGGVGNPVNLTFSFVPDGTFVPNGGLGSGASSLFARMNALFGGDTELWKNQFRSAFGRWGDLSGLSYTEVSDDGAPLHNSPGLGTTRGDLRISMIPFNDNNVLAYCFFPNVGDMVLNRNISWNNSSNSYRFFRNIVMHEEGHGFGLAHVDPTNGTKLMEAFLNTNFDGPQNDDIQGVQWYYGDDLENNDNNGASTDLGTLSEGQLVENVAIERPADPDWFKIHVSPGTTVRVIVNPIGSDYFQGPQGGTTHIRHSKAINNLRITAYRTDGTTVLGTADVNPTGSSETLEFTPQDNGDARVKIDVSSTVNDIQRYQMQFQLIAGGNEETVTPDSFTMFRGSVVSGGLGDIQTSNNSYLTVRPGAVFSNSEYPIQLIVEGNTSLHTPTEVHFSIESFVSTNNLQRKIELFNYDTDTYEQVDLQGASQTEGVVEVNITSDAARFVDSATGNIKAKVSWKATAATFVYPWTSKIDHIFWVINS
jgi:hypothetical protein